MLRKQVKTSPMSGPAEVDDGADDCSTQQAANRLGLAVRSVQLMVDRGELQAWKTPGGHRRISRSSLEQWIAARGAPVAASARPPQDSVRPAAEVHAAAAAQTSAGAARHGVVVIEDSKHYQRLVSLLLQDQFPELDVQMADDGISGLAMVGRVQPQLLIVDILLPGIDGPTLISSLRSNPQFADMQLIVITSLGEPELAPYRFALEGVPVVHKTRLVTDLPLRLRELLSLA